MDEQPHTNGIARLDRVLILALAATAIIARVLPGERTIDDAYITFRYARNIVDGVGFVYNPGQQVLGTTTPLFTTLMALLGFATGSGAYPAFALVVSALADAVTCALLYLMDRRLIGSRAAGAVLGVLWAIGPMSVTFAIGGMETGVFILLMVATFWLYVEGRARWAALTAALGVLTRPDALAWAGLVFLHQFWARFREREERPLREWLPWRAWLILAGALLPWVIFALAYFGSPIPRSAGAKALTYTLPPGATLVRLVQHFATPFFEYDALGPVGTTLGMVLYPALFAIGALKIARGAAGGGRALPMLVYPWPYAAIFAVTNLLIFRWYLAPPLPAYFLGIVAGAWTLGGALGRTVGAQRAAPLQRGIFAVIAVIWVALSLKAWRLHPDHGPDRPAPEMAFVELEMKYEEVGRMLANEYGVTADTVVAAGDIGAVGYYSRATIFDTIGLVTPDATAYYPVDPAIIVEGANYAVPPQLILDATPEFVIIVESYGRLGLMQDPGFVAQYGEEPIETLDIEIYKGKGMLVFRRNAPGDQD